MKQDGLKVKWETKQSEFTQEILKSVAEQIKENLNL